MKLIVGLLFVTLILGINGLPALQNADDASSDLKTDGDIKTVLY